MKPISINKNAAKAGVAFSLCNPSKGDNMLNLLEGII
jgi:hypothetical protein